ncbi:MAG: hypothetical protein IJS32_03235 [Kiritimatiellae bacterium]|nr:hypothetical protein [Kiritimatiellia bacterium]
MERNRIWVLAAAALAVCAFCVWNTPERQISRRLGKALALLEKEAGENPVTAAGKAARLQDFLADGILVGSRRHGIEETFPKGEFVRQLFAARAEFSALAVERGRLDLAFPAKGEAEARLVARLAGESPWWSGTTQECRLDLHLRKDKRQWRLEALAVSFAEDDTDH